MKKTNRKGFTIVELVIVIAVIGILAAVLIPTFAGIIESANRAADTQLVANINTILAIEDVVGGGVNDAVEIQNVIKKNGLKLETKVKGQYLWYDIDAKRVVLGGLSETGIVIDGVAPAAEGDTDSKGKFNEDTTAPENFIKGYLFLSTESADNLAENIYALRNPEGATAAAISASLNDTLGKIKNTALKNNLSAMLSTTAVMAKNGVTGFIGSNNSSVTRVIVSSEMTNISTDTISTVLAYPNVVAVDFHSAVVTAADDAITTLKNRTEKPYFIYTNDELKKVDTDNGDLEFLIHKDERGQYIKNVYVQNVITGGKELIAEFTVEEEKYEFPYNLTYKYHPGIASESYDFVAYSFYDDGSNPLAEGEHTYKLNSTEKLLIDGEGNLTIYLVYERATSDFKIGNDYYSSKTTTRKLAKKEITSGTITVVSTTATLGDATYNEITIPSGVTLHLPYYTDINNKVYSTSTAAKNKNSITGNGGYAVFDKLTVGGNSKLTIADGVTLKNNGTVYVDAQLYYTGTNVQAHIKNTTCAVLVVDGTLETTGTLYAYGVVRGAGEVVASEGQVVELLTILDWPGGTIASNNIEENVSPFNNWLADNIRVKMTLKKGIKYVAFGAVSLSVVGTQAMEFVLVDDTTSTNPLFLMDGANTELQKTYGDGYKLDIIAGTVKDTKKEVSVSSYTIKFYETAMPLPNFDITVKAGAALELNNNLYKILPGSDIVVEEAKDGKNAGKLTINTAVAFYDSFDLKMIEYYKANQKVSVDVGSVTINSCTYSDNLKSLTLTGKYGWSTSTGSCAVITYSVVGYDGTTSLMNNGNLVFGDNARFTGDIESTVEGAKIEIAANAKFENKSTITNSSGTNIVVHGFKEGVASTVRLNIGITELPISFYQPTYDANVDLTGNFKVDLDYDVIPDGSSEDYKPAYIYNGNVWVGQSN